jgi:hypothetical protein
MRVKKTYVDKLCESPQFRQAFKESQKYMKNSEIEALTKIILHSHTIHDYPCFKCRETTKMRFNVNNRDCLCEKVEKWCRFVAKQIIKKSQP